MAKPRYLKEANQVPKKPTEALCIFYAFEFSASCLQSPTGWHKHITINYCKYL